MRIADRLREKGVHVTSEKGVSSDAPRTAG